MKPREKLDWIYNILPKDTVFHPYKYYYVVSTFLNISDKAAERCFRTMGALGWIKEETYGFRKMEKPTGEDKLLEGFEDF